MDLGVGRQLSYRAAKRLLVGTGLVVLGATAAVLYVRRVETTEVVAVLLFVPIYLSVVAGKVRGGLIAAVLASISYGVLRLGGVDAYDSSQQFQLVASRSIAYLAFGLIGGLAVQQIEAALMKLDRYDLIDDSTGLFNARFAANELGLELARGTRYGSVFSVIELVGPVAPLLAVRRSRRSTALRAMGIAVSDALRLVDRAAVAKRDDQFHVVAVMPETPSDGALVVAGRLADAVSNAFHDSGVADAGGLEAHVFTFPDDEAAISTLRVMMVGIEADEHPEAVLVA